MLHFKILTLFPKLFEAFSQESLIGKAIANNRIRFETIDYRQFGLGKHHKVDDTPYGGGAGMVLRPEPVDQAIGKCEENGEVHKILISPQGSRFTQESARRLSRMKKPILMICGRFEGFDERIRTMVDEEISIGDYILMGGETAAMAIVEAVGRLIPGVIGNALSLGDESHSTHLLEYAQYTKPLTFKGLTVPEILLSGNHAKIAEWRTANAIEKTRARRPDLWQRYTLESAEG